MIPITTRQFIYEIGQLRLRGDVIIRCYQITTNERNPLQSMRTISRELIFSTQFHTCAIEERDITFYRGDLDYACEGKPFSLGSLPLINDIFTFRFSFPHSSPRTDPRIPVDHRVTLHFGDNSQPNENRGLFFQSPLVKLEPLNAIAKYNSLERFDDGEYLTHSLISSITVVATQSAIAYFRA